MDSDEMTGAPQRKPTLDTVNYRNAGDDGKSCANCQYFNAPDQCTMVDGTVSAAGVCDLYSKKANEADLMDQLFGGAQDGASAPQVPPAAAYSQ